MARKSIYGYQYWGAKWILCKAQYFRRQWLTDSYILYGYLKITINTEYYLQYLPELREQPDKKTKHGNETYKELFGTCIKSKKAYINTVCTKSASKDSQNYFAIFGASVCQDQHVFSMSFLTCTGPWSSHTNGN